MTSQRSDREFALISLQFDDDVLLAEIRDAIELEFRVRTTLGECHHDISPFFDAARSQYNADELLNHLDSLNPGRGRRTIAVTTVDLFTPILSYLFGQAYLGGRTAIVSGYRLRNERYGLARDDQLYRQRLLKTVLHELGHSLGLKHCINPDCVMVASTYVEDVDQKSAHYCQHCRNLLEL